MSTDDQMPDSWNRNASGRSAEITAAIVRAREARAATAQAAPVDELALRRSARVAAEDARRRLRPTEPPTGPRTA